MVRRCCAPNCTETDKSILAHRFPKDDKTAAMWQKSLQMEETPLLTLRVCFVVCTKHFGNSSYRNEASNCLNTTAVPTVEYNECNMRAEYKEKDKNLTPLRCYKRPSASPTNPQPSKRIKILGNTLIKKLPHVPSEIAKQEEEEVSTSNHNEQHQDENYECEDSAAYSAAYDFMVKDTVKAVPPPAPTYASQGTMTAKVVRSNATTQTDKAEGEVSEYESKDDKLIKLLYPEFSKCSKIDLIKIIISKNEAIRNLL